MRRDHFYLPGQQNMTTQPVFSIQEENNEKKVIASVPVPKGTEIWAFTGMPMYYSETLQLGENESFALQVGKALFIYLG